MAIIPKILDPVQGLIDYTLTIKPYHSKIIEVLEEYIHTDYLYVTMSDRIDFCINFGIPNLNTFFSYDIVQIDLVDNSVIVNGDARLNVHIGQSISIEFSTYNNNQYYVNDINYDIDSNISIVTLRESLISDDTSGKIVHSVIEYCPSSGLKTSNILPPPNLVCEGGYGEIYDSIMALVLQISTLDISSENSIILQGDHVVALENTTTISLIDSGLYPNDIMGTFRIDSYSYDGINTIVHLVEPIHTFPNYNSSVSYNAFINYLGYDKEISCDLNGDPNNSETLFVSMIENFDMSITIDFQDAFKTYNMENSYNSTYDNIRFGVINSVTQPIIPESLIPPSNPNLFDLWFDTDIYVLKQWHNYQWLPIKYVYWYQEDVVNPQHVTHYKLIKNKNDDTGWLEVDPELNDELSLGFDLDPYSLLKNTYVHPSNQIEIDPSINGLFLTGGDFTQLLLNNTTIKTYSTESYLGSFNHTFYQIKSKSNNEIILEDSNGDLSNIFVNGISFRIELPELQNRDFNVVSSIFDGTNTIIQISENLNVYDFGVNDLGLIPSIFYVQPNSLGINQTSTLYIPNLPIDPSINILEYVYNGPLQITTTLFNSDSVNTTLTETGFSNELLITNETTSSSGDIAQTTFIDEVVWEWGNIDQWFQYFVTGITDLNNIVLAGNGSVDIQLNQQIRIIGPTDNIGIYTVSNISFNGISTNIELLEPMQSNNLYGMYIEPIDILPIRLILEDTIGAELDDSAIGTVIGDSGNMVKSLDYKYFDIGGFDHV